MAFHVPEQYRLTDPRWRDIASDCTYGNNGGFAIPSHIPTRLLFVIATDNEGWEHVSVHAMERKGKRQWTPTWDEMCQIKDLYWDEEDVVIQYHPKRSEYVSYHPYTLHLWRPIGVDIPTPPVELVGPQGVSLVYAK